MHVSFLNIFETFHLLNIRKEVFFPSHGTQEFEHELLAFEQRQLPVDGDSAVWLLHIIYWYVTYRWNYLEVKLCLHRNLFVYMHSIRPLWSWCWPVVFKVFFFSKLLLSDQTFCLIVANISQEHLYQSTNQQIFVELGDAGPAVASLIGLGQKMVKL